jgi:hypothetical protein
VLPVPPDPFPARPVERLYLDNLAGCIRYPGTGLSSERTPHARWGPTRMEQPMTWAPPECTLPTAEQPLRVAEFDELFATALRGRARPGPAHLRLTLDGGAEVEARTRDLIARETACCSLFAFALTRTPGGQLQLDVQVPEGRTDVLDAIAARAGAATHVAGSA